MSRPKFLAVPLIVLLTVLVFAFACGGGSETGSGSNTDTPGGSATETTEELSPRGTNESQITLDTTLETTYYPVEGTTTETIFSHIERNGPTDGEGKRGSGLTSVVWGYEWQGGPEGGPCTIHSMTIRAEMVVTLPQHSNMESLPASIHDKWLGYAASVAEHEQTHVDIYNEGAEIIRERMLALDSSQDCDRLEEEIKRVWDEEQAEINRRQAEFHDQEATRLAQKRAPLAAQIDANRARIYELQSQIETLNGVVTALRNEIDSLIAEINHIDERIKEVNSSNMSTQDKQAELFVLVEQRNAVQARHNRAVDEHNAALVQREPLEAQRNHLIDETNALVDEFNWTR